MVQQNQAWNQMAKSLWEVQVQEQVLELRNMLSDIAEPDWSQMIQLVAWQLLLGQSRISVLTSMKHVSDCNWSASALHLWEAQVKEQLLELEELGDNQMH